MAAASIPADEASRLTELAALDVLDTEPEASFDDLTALAARLCDAPIALVSLIDATRQWFKARVGLSVRETPREHAFCAHAIHHTEPLVVGNALEDPRFADNPLVTGHPDIRFYAGVPLTLVSGARVGTLCVIDNLPRGLTAVQLDDLTRLARQVAALLELRGLSVAQRIANARLQEEIQKGMAATEALGASEFRFHSVLEQLPLPAAITRDGHYLYANRRLAQLHGANDPTSLIGLKVWKRLTPRSQEEWHARQARRRSGVSVESEFELSAQQSDGSEIVVAATVQAINLPDGPAQVSFLRDITAQKRISAVLEFLAHRGWARRDQDFFPALVEFIGKLTGKAYVFIGQLVDDGQAAETIAVYAHGQIVLNRRYGLAGTVCVEALRSGLCHYPSGVQRQFPDDSLLAELQIESYVGKPLWNANGTPIGLIAVMDTRPMLDLESVGDFIRIAAARAGAELDRARKDAEIRRVSAYNRSIIEANAHALLVLGLDGNIVDLNTKAQEITGTPREALLGSSFSTLFTTRTKPLLLLRQVLAGRPPSQLELIITRATGDLLPVNVSAATFPDDAGRIGGIVINLMDLSERKALERLVITAGVEEQQRLGAELHDGLGQQLTGLALLLSAAANKVRSGSSNGLSQLEEAAALARSSVESCRQIAHGMSPLTHTQGDLLDALGKMAKTMNKLGGPAFRFIAPCDPLPTLQPEAKDHLYRIAQEACANAQRHAAAKSVTIGVEVTPTVVRMFVEDDGTGLSDGHRMTAGLGLKSMHYRASLIGASLDVRSGSRHGTRIECDVAV